MPKSDKPTAADATKLLAEDHREVEKLVEKFKKLKNGDFEKKHELVRQACTELMIHAQIEEELFYPALRQALDDGDMINEAHVEHSVAKQLIRELEGMSPQDEMFDAKFTVLGEYVQHHVQEEEEEIFPKAKRAKELDLQELGERLLERKQQLQSEMSA